MVATQIFFGIFTPILTWGRKSPILTETHFSEMGWFNSTTNPFETLKIQCQVRDSHGEICFTPLPNHHVSLPNKNGHPFRPSTENREVWEKYAHYSSPPWWQYFFGGRGSHLANMLIDVNDVDLGARVVKGILRVAFK